MTTVQIFLDLLAEMDIVNTSSLTLFCPLLYIIPFFLGFLFLFFFALFCWFLSWASSLFPFPATLLTPCLPDFFLKHHSYIFSCLLNISIGWYFADFLNPTYPSLSYWTCFHLLITIWILGIIILSHKSKLEIALSSLTRRFSYHLCPIRHSFFGSTWKISIKYFSFLLCNALVQVPHWSFFLWLFPLVHFPHCYQTHFQHSLDNITFLLRTSADSIFFLHCM